MINRSNLGFHENAIVAITFATNGKVLATGGQDRTIRLWDIPVGLQGAQLHATRQLAHKPVSLAFSPDATRLASGFDNGSIHLWDVGPELLEQTVITPPFAPLAESVSDLAFSRNGRQLACGTDKGVSVLDATSGTVLWTRMNGPVESTAFSNSPADHEDRRPLAVAHGNRVRFHRTDTGVELTGGPPADIATIRSVAFGGNAEFGGHQYYFVWGGDGAQVTVTNLLSQSHPVVARFGRDDPVTWVGFSGNGRRLAALDRSGRFTMWNAIDLNFNSTPFRDEDLGPVEKIAPYPRDVSGLIFAVGLASGQVQILNLEF